ncbi:hypothetical protein Poly24_09180 [Rosistilla carotiformis]|uniref:DUF3299 domain-containing protein n=1 Tax=Rosistilla carotiformis TaxID=2528017 RepID=A0A518JNU6_9BACT|nr:DUF3299 domain-containing protein [Rosistilla carotiformis]QDV67225.1 hypothetical protein Poly24_09180 [Rosistilla carotiformis]
MLSHSPASSTLRIAICWIFASTVVLPLTAAPIEKDEGKEAEAAATTTERPARGLRPDPSEAKPAAPPRRMPPKRKGEISFDTILFEMDKEADYDPSMVTPEIKALEGKEVTIRGFILPASVFQQVGIKQFVLVRDNQECCFGPGAALYDCIMVRMAGDNGASFSTRPVAVKGKFHLTEKYKYPDGKYLAIYEMEATKVE